MGKRGPPPDDIPGLDIFVRGIVDWMRDGRPGGVKISQAINEFAAANGCSSALIWKKVEAAQPVPLLPRFPASLNRSVDGVPVPGLLPVSGMVLRGKEQTRTFALLKEHLQWLEDAPKKGPSRPLVEARSQRLRERLVELTGNTAWLTWPRRGSPGNRE